MANLKKINNFPSDLPEKITKFLYLFNDTDVFDGDKSGDFKRIRLSDESDDEDYADSESCDDVPEDSDAVVNRTTDLASDETGKTSGNVSKEPQVVKILPTINF